MSVTTPASATSGVAFLVSAVAGLHNNGPDGPVTGDITFTLHLPADCTASSPTTVVVTGRVLSTSVPVSVSRAWNVTCMLGGIHQFSVDGSLAVSAGQVLTDPNPTNNSGSGTANTQVN